MKRCTPMKPLFGRAAACILLVCLLLSCAACGSADSAGEGLRLYDKAAGDDMSIVAYANGAPSEEWEAKDGTYGLDLAESKAETTPLAGRKVIRNVTLTAETKDYEEAVRALEETVAVYDGYVQSLDAYGLSENSYRSTRSAHYVLRIPAERLDAFLGEVGQNVNVVSRSANVSDITETYTDIEARLTSLKTEETRLLELLAEAKDLNAVLTLEDKLSDVRYQIESYTARLRGYDTLVAYATVTLSLNEVITYTEPEVVSPTFGERIAKAFRTSWKRFAQGCQNTAVEFVYAIPTLLVLVVILGGGLWLVIRKVRTHRRKKAEQRTEAPDDAPKAP